MDCFQKDWENFSYVIIWVLETLKQLLTVSKKRLNLLGLREKVKTLNF